MDKSKTKGTEIEIGKSFYLRQSKIVVTTLLIISGLYLFVGTTYLEGITEGQVLYGMQDVLLLLSLIIAIPMMVVTFTLAYKMFMLKIGKSKSSLTITEDELRYKSPLDTSHTRIKRDAITQIHATKTPYGTKVKVTYTPSIWTGSKMPVVKQIVVTNGSWGMLKKELKKTGYNAPIQVGIEAISLPAV